MMMSVNGRTACWAAGLVLGVGTAGLLSGCQSAVRLDPNEPVNAMHSSADSLRANLDSAYDDLEYRVRRGEFTAEERDARLQEHAAAFVKNIDINRLPVDDLWKYGEIFRTAGRWDLARAAYALALKNATTDDRRVNDSLKLAFAEVKLGNIPAAFPLVRSTYQAAPGDKGAILPAVLLEIVPAAAGKGYEAEFAALLVEAIRQHETVVVDPETEGGRAFIAAKIYHIRNAWVLAINLYNKAGQTAQSAKTRQEAESSLRRFVPA